MKALWKNLILAVVALGVLAGLVFAFIVARKEVGEETEREKPIKAPTRVEVSNGQNIIMLDEAARTNSGVILARLESVLHRSEVPAYGVVVDLQELTDLHNSLENGDAQLSKAKASLEVARLDYDRVKSLYEKNHNVSEKVLQAAEGTLRAEEANVQTAQAMLTSAEATTLQHWGPVIADWLAKSAPEFDRLELQKDVLIQATLSPGQTLAAPKDATVQTAEGRPIEAKFVSPALRTDPKIQGRSFFYLAPEQSDNLLPGMAVTVLLPMGDPVPGVIVPDSCVVWLRGKAWVYEQVKPGRFARREASLESPITGGWFEPASFSQGELFVIKGPQVLLSEEFRAQISLEEEGK